MLTFEWSPYLLEIPNHAIYDTQSILIGCSTLSQEYCKLIGLYWKSMRRQLWTLTCPIDPNYHWLSCRTSYVVYLNELKLSWLIDVTCISPVSEKGRLRSLSSSVSDHSSLSVFTIPWWSLSLDLHVIDTESLIVCLQSSKLELLLDLSSLQCNLTIVERFEKYLENYITPNNTLMYSWGLKLIHLFYRTFSA